MSAGREAIERYYKLLAKRDIEGLHSILSPDVVVAYHAGEGRLPWAGRFEGIAGFDAFFGIVSSHCEVVSVERGDWIVEGNRVVVPCVGHWRIPATGADVRGSMLNIFTVNEGLVSGYDVHADTDAFVQGMELAHDHP